MKDITITGKRIRTELRWLLLGFILAVVLNIYSIIKYDTAWSELVSTLHILLIMAVIIYVILLFFRGLASLLIRFSSGRNKE
jgi:heme/copper-type cytochrome/quinol oxidase subunit 4